ncbi:GEVED domain-containing protein [Pseudomarimonas salicorniae]|uniref:GEVED domain-containing protein n=1 Tax=Pseudomarimonas salicorniae TaxID=2933270 RepID=A0ABT0GKF2_9GAMM|nr:GEVED domain-containing protein [Lysobacter sp. CAU 1642]MCK7595040.1 GEVED domain-containing protein [Lysobacter sp. CAU 1642]
MSRTLVLSAALVACLAPAALLAATVDGTVFADLDGDGVFDSAGVQAELGIAGATVQAQDELGNTTSVTTGATGAYSVTLPGSQLRIEVTQGARIEPARSSLGAGSRPNVFFVSGSQSGRHVGFADPGHFCQTSPEVIANVYSNGNPNSASGASGANSWMVRAPFFFSDDTSNPPNATVAVGRVMGSTWGLAYQRSTDSVFAAAFAKRHSGFGVGDGVPAVADGANTNESGAIYRVANPLDAAPTVSLLVDLQAFGIDTGSIDRTENTATSELEAPGTTATDPNIDADAFDKVGKVGLGGLALSDDERTLWTVNLNDRRLYEIPLTVSGASVSANGAGIVAHDLPASGAMPTCANGVFRPFAVNYHQGFVYVGGVCTAEGAGGTAANLSAHILRHDPTGADGNFTSFASFSDLTYTRGAASTDSPNDPTNNSPGSPLSVSGNWGPWIDEWSDIANPAPDAGPFGQTIEPQPMLSDLEFDVDGTLVLSFMDRFGHQSGNENYSPLAADGVPREVYEGVSAGDLLLACLSGGSYTLESAGGCPGRTSDGATNGQGPGGGEFFWHDKYQQSGVYPPNATPTTGAHREITLGGVAIHFPRREAIATVFDPRNAFRAAGWRVLNLVNTAGTGTNAGENLRSVEIFGQDAGGAEPVRFGKAAGIGNLELICSPPVLEIGNRVWLDTDLDGIQDAGEPPVSGVTLTLYRGGTQIGATSTDANGEWYFAVTQSSTPDASTGDNDVRLANPHFSDYQVAIDPANFASGGALFGMTPTARDADGGPNGDARDSDVASINVAGIGNRQGINFSVGGPGGNFHTLDMGFVMSDLGDLPDSGAGVGAGNYETLLANGGPVHPILAGLRLGSVVDDEADGVPSLGADGDDLAGAPDDEDGVDVSDLSLSVGSPALIDITATNTTGSAARVCGFIDFNGDGDFLDAGESTSVAVPDGSNDAALLLNFGVVPAGSASNTYARFRLSTDTVSVCSANGSAPDGEVEDYPVSIATPITFDFGDLPDPAAGTASGDYPTRLADDGARHIIVAGLFMGAGVDAEVDGAPTTAANGDDLAGTDDEDGVTVADLNLTQGSLANIRVTATNSTGSAARICGFVDFNGDGDFADANETQQVAVPNGSAGTIFTLAFGTVPSGAASSTYSRFRLSTAAVACSATGQENDGEVEDYPVSIIAPASFDLGDLPDPAAGIGSGNYQTRIADGGARHPIVSGLRMGASVDAEADGAPNVAANGDDLAGTDDEDGVDVSDLSLREGDSPAVDVVVTNTTGSTARLCGFIDYNGDGDFLDAGETASTTILSGNSNLGVVLNFGVVPTGSAANSYARFRLSTDTAGACSAVGDATDGEVEDYPVAIAPVLVGLGNLVWEDLDNNGIAAPSEPRIAGVAVRLFRDDDGNCAPDGAVLASTATDGSGLYAFTGLTPGAYLVEIDPPAGFIGSTGSGFPYQPSGPYEPAPDPDNDVDNDDNGTRVGNVIRSCGITLSAGGEVADGDADDNNNPSVDFGLLRQFDLALRKTLAPGQPEFIPDGAPVRFTITVFNQGELVARNIQVTDYIPTGMALADAGWTAGSGNTATRIIPGPLAPGQQTELTITLDVTDNALTSFVNRAEISDATDDMGIRRRDIDSTPDGDVDNDGTPTDDAIDNRNADEDDADFASVRRGSPPRPPVTVPGPTGGVLILLGLAMAAGGFAQTRRRSRR